MSFLPFADFGSFQTHVATPFAIACDLTATVAPPTVARQATAAPLPIGPPVSFSVAAMEAASVPPAFGAAGTVWNVETLSSSFVSTW